MHRLDAQRRHADILLSAAPADLAMTTSPHSPFPFATVDALLARWQWLWQPAPFVETVPSWHTQQPALYQALLGLSENEYRALAGDDDACLRWLCDHLPALAELQAYRDEGEIPVAPAQRLSPGMGARKQGQVNAFVNAGTTAGQRLIEWCAGQGWLLEGLGRRFPERELAGLEWQPRLCEQGNQRLRQAGVTATLHCTDVLHQAPAFQSGDSLFALHACGHLHQSLLRQSAAQLPGGLTLSPCCYHLGERTPLSRRAQTALLDGTLIDRHLAVQDSGIGHGNRQRRAEKGSQWRLGYELLRQQQTGDPHYRSAPSWPGHLWRGSFADFCHHCARHHGITLATDIDFDFWQAAGEARHRAVRRLELPRRQFRRLLEWWLALDLGWYLCEHGYRVQVLPFCSAALTPRNLMIRAERI
jgi:hypothetical protein